MHYLYIFLAGGIGTLCRFGISKASIHLFSINFPISTFISNTLSCLILALTVLYFHDKTSVNPVLKLIIITGFCGGFSTFSAFSFETVILIKQSNYFLAIVNVMLSLMVGMGLLFFLIAKDKVV